MRAGADERHLWSFVGPGFCVGGGDGMAERWKTGKHHPAAVYAKQVVYGKLRPMCGPYEIKACERFLRDLARQGTASFPY